MASQSSGAQSATKRKSLISGNWKMNLNHFEAIQTVQKLYWALKPDDYRAADISIHPPFTDLRSIQTVLEADSIPIALGAQNCYFEDTGAFTGEVSPAFLAKLNVSYVIVGHSERRQIFGESDEMVAKKTAAVLRNGMSPIVGVGETMAEREAQRTEEVITGQLNAVLSAVKADDMAKMVISYEPVWAIGTGTPTTPDDAQGMCKLLRSMVSERFGADAASALRIQYGASVKPGNAADFLAGEDVDGLLVGGSSIVPDEFARIVAAVHG